MGRQEHDGAPEKAVDARFAALQTDPRFQRFPKSKRTVQIDARFAGMFKDADFQTKAAVDKRGRKVEGNKKVEDMRRYYRLNDEFEREYDAKKAKEKGQQHLKPDEEQQQQEAKQKRSLKADTAAAAAAAAVSGGSGAKQDNGAGSVAPKQRGQLAKAARPAVARADVDDGAAAARQQEPGRAKRPQSLPGKVQRSTATAAAAAAAAAEAESSDGGAAVPAAAESLDASESEEDAEQLRWARARGLVDVSSSSDDEDEEHSGDEELADEDSGGSSSAEPSDDDEDGQEIDAEEWGVGMMAGNPEEPIPLSDETSRLALVDLDWERTRAVDILVVLRSFLPKRAAIRRVTVYPSDYGLQRMAEDAAIGPQIFKAKAAPGADANGAAKAARGKAGKRARAQDDSDDEDGDDEQRGDSASSDDELLSGDDSPGEGSSDDGDGSSDDEDGLDDGLEDDADVAGGGGGSSDDADVAGGGGVSSDDADEDGGTDVDKLRLHMYERSKLRYYYAIVECDSVATAAHLYAECDGMEFERSACKFDLRFVPDGQSFEGRQVRDTADDVPASYVPPAFLNNSLQHTDPKLTWDADDEGRKKQLQRKLTEEEIKEQEFAAYLATDDEDDSGDEGLKDADAIRKRYQALLLGGGADKDATATDRKGGKSWGAAEDDEDASADDEDGSSEDDARGRNGAGPSARFRGRGDMEMEVTFTPGLESLGSRLLAKKQEEQGRKGETVWEAYMRRRKEKKKARKAKGRRGDSSDDDDDDEVSDDPHAAAAHGGDDPFFMHDDDPFSDPFFAGADGAGEQEGGAAAVAARQQTSRNAGTSGRGAAAPGEGADKEPKRDKDKRAKGAAAADATDKAGRRREQAELELLMLDDSALRNAAKGVRSRPTVDDDHADAPRGAAGGARAKPAAGAAAVAPAKLTKKEKRAAAKVERRARREGSDEEDKEDFQVDLQDPRFKQMVESHDFALDPTDSRFQSTKNIQRVAEEVSKKRRKLEKQQRQSATDSAVAAATVNGAHADGAAARGEADTAAGAAAAAQDRVALNAMVAKLKRKGQEQGTGSGKRTKL